MKTAAEIDAAIYRNMLRYYAIREHDGWTGVFTDQQSPMAKIKNGHRVEKIASDDGDAHPVGSSGTVLGSIGAPSLGVSYFVEFDSTPRQASLVAERKIAALPVD